MDEIQILDAISINMNGGEVGLTAVGAPSSPAPSKASSTFTARADPATFEGRLYEHGLKLISFGKYKGKPFWYAWQDTSYVDWRLNEVNEGSCRGLKDLVL